MISEGFKMKKTLKRLALIAMAVVMAATSSLCLGAEDTAAVETPETFETEYTRLQYLSEAYRMIDEGVKSGGAPHWSDSSVIYDERPIYSCYDKIIGYTFAISTDDEPTGYLQLMDYGNGPEFSKSSTRNVPDFLTCADFIEEKSVDGKLYGGLGMYNLIKTESGNYIVLGWDETLTTTECQQVYEETFYRRRADDEQESVTVEHPEESVKTEEQLESLYDGIDYPWAVCGDYEDVYITNKKGISQAMQNFSSPLAGANIIGYLKSLEISPIPDSYSDNAILTGMYTAMDTNDYATAAGYTCSGTEESKIQFGFLSFCQSYSAGTPATSVYTSASDITEAKLKSYLDNGCLLLTTVSDYMGSAHSMVIFGYMGSTFYVADGINRGYTCVSGDELPIDHLMTVKF